MSDMLAYFNKSFAGDTIEIPRFCDFIYPDKDDKQTETAEQVKSRFDSLRRAE